MSSSSNSQKNTQLIQSGVNKEEARKKRLRDSVQNIVKTVEIRRFGNILKENNKDVTTIANCITNKLFDIELAKELIKSKLYNRFIGSTDTLPFEGTPLINYIGLDKEEGLINEIIEEISNSYGSYEFIFKLPKSILENSDFVTEILPDLKLIKINKKEPKSSYVFRNENNSICERENLEENDCVMSFTSKGYILESGLIKLENGKDPLFLYKVIIAFYYCDEKNHDWYLLFREDKGLDNFKITVFKDGKYKTTLLKSYEERFFLNSLNSLGFTKDSSSEKTKFLKELLTQTQISYPIENSKSDYIDNIKEYINNINCEKDRITRALYWLYEVMKENEEQKKIVFLTSAFDALMEIEDTLLKKNGFTEAKEKHFATATYLANEFIEIVGITKILSILYNNRNLIIHGKNEIKWFDEHLPLNDENSKKLIIDQSLYLLQRLINKRILQLYETCFNKKYEEYRWLNFAKRIWRDKKK